MTDEDMLEAQLDMSLDEIIAKGSKLNQPKGNSDRVRGGRGRERAKKGGRPQGDLAKDMDMDVDISAPKKLTVTIQNNLKPKGGVAKKGPTGRAKEQFKNAAKAVHLDDEKPRPRVDLDSVTWKHDMFKPEGPSKPRMMNVSRNGRQAVGGDRQTRPEVKGKQTKLMISNLADEVDNNDIQELFSRIGTLKQAQIIYDRIDRPTGRAEVEYLTEADAQAAFAAYNGVALDGMKMLIKIVAERPRGDGSFRLSSGLEVSGRGSAGGIRSAGTQPRGRGTAGRLKSSARVYDVDDENMD